MIIFFVLFDIVLSRRVVDIFVVIILDIKNRNRKFVQYSRTSCLLTNQ